LVGGEDRRHVDAHAALRERAHRLEQRLAAGVGHRQLDVDVAAPRGDLAGLGDHLRDIVGEHLERDVAVGHGGDEIAGIGLVVRHAGLLEQRRVGGEAADPRLLRHVHDLRLVGAVGEELDLETGKLRHVRLVGQVRASPVCRRRDALPPP
jgi:hypothetical protein